jgi:hypothetical protein
MQLSRFLADLFEHGHLRLDDQPWDDDEDRRAVDAVLAARAETAAADFPSPAPAYDPAAAAWAARQIVRACRFIVLRDDPIDTVRAKLAEPIPAGDAAAQHFSVDLVFRFLPDVDRLTTTLSLNDPLREILREWGGAWPLSSVGMKAVKPLRTEELLAHAGLRRAYIDRIVACRDSSRLADPQIRDLVHAALGRARVEASAWCREAVDNQQPTSNK